VQRSLTLLNLHADLADLEEASRQFDQNLAEIVAQNAKIKAYVAKLESRDATRAGAGRGAGQRPAAGLGAGRGDRAVPEAATPRVIVARRLAALVCAALLWSLPTAAAERPVVTWHPAKPQLGAVAWVHVQGAGSSATIEGALGPRTLTFFPYAGGQAAVVGIDLETKPGVEAWRLVVMEPAREARTLTGRVTIQRRDFPVQKLTLPTGMVDLDPETERRAVSEGERLRALYGTITPERLWRGHFVRPVAGHEPPSGFGARRIINGKPRAPHSGTDYAAERGTPVIAVNSGRVALVADFFFPGRLVVVDHGLGCTRCISTSTPSPSPTASRSIGASVWGRLAPLDERRGRICTSARSSPARGSIRPRFSPSTSATRDMGGPEGAPQSPRLLERPAAHRKVGLVTSPAG
jgi:murein DD-endopeptidase MepM/ murein hydrolase activator NlpD